MGNKLLNRVEIAEQEFCWDLPELPMTQSSVKVTFISTCPPDDSVFIAKDDSILQEMDPDSEDVRVAGNIEKYANHPAQLEDWCFTEYISQLDMRTKKFVTAIDTEETYDNKQIQSDDNDSASKGTELNNLFPIYLRNKVIYKHKKCKVIHFVNFKYKVDPVNYFQEQLLLYTPWRCEETDLYYGKQKYVEAFDLKRSVIEEKKKSVNHYP